MVATKVLLGLVAVFVTVLVASSATGTLPGNGADADIIYDYELKFADSFESKDGSLIKCDDPNEKWVIATISVVNNSSRTITSDGDNWELIYNYDDEGGEDISVLMKDNALKKAALGEQMTFKVLFEVDKDVNLSGCKVVSDFDRLKAVHDARLL